MDKVLEFIATNISSIEKVIFYSDGNVKEIIFKQSYNPVYIYPDYVYPYYEYTYPYEEDNIVWELL